MFYIWKLNSLHCVMGLQLWQCPFPLLLFHVCIFHLITLCAFSLSMVEVPTVTLTDVTRILLWLDDWPYKRLGWQPFWVVCVCVYIYTHAYICVQATLATISEFKESAVWVLILSRWKLFWSNRVICRTSPQESHFQCLLPWPFLCS